jgi:hypothetical protein
MKLSLSFALTAVMIAARFSVAAALPGEPFAAVKARAQHSPFTVKCTISEMSGTPFCSQTGHYLGAQFNRNFSDDGGNVTYQEMIWYNLEGFRFLTRTDPRVRGLLAAIYDAALAQDFLDAKIVASVPVYQSTKRARFLRGKRFGYVAGGDGGFTLTIFRAADLDKEIQNARRCATVECGD